VGILLYFQTSSFAFDIMIDASRCRIYKRRCGGSNVTGMVFIVQFYACLVAKASVVM
jgi:hypothetical protein